MHGNTAISYLKVAARQSQTSVYLASALCWCLGKHTQTALHVCSYVKRCFAASGAASEELSVLHFLHLSAAAVAVAPSKASKGPAELVLVPGESELHKARRSHGCCFRAEVSCMVSSAAVLHAVGFATCP
jgi:hypothetical protein